ncbi:MAG TPA: transglutaminase domain-containing protein [Flavitalea sp.]|nr:transglutaminase domain-containing protein [Flavitalea sp.]
MEDTSNPMFRNNTAFESYEDLSLQKFDSLRQKYQTDTIFHGEQDEFKRVLLLRDWIRKVIHIQDYGDPYPGDGYAERILDAAIKGQGFHCGHYMVVQNAIMNAYGYVTRCIGSGPGIKGGPDGHHGINEIWLNKYHKWFLSDAKYNHHFEKNGIPLSALEVRDEYLKNKAADVVLVKGAKRTPIESDGIADSLGIYVKNTRADFARWYTWIEWDKINNRYSSWPNFTNKLNMYRDDYFKNHVWIWDGKPHWAYNTDVMNLVDSREAIEWTPNTISGTVAVKDQSATISLKSVTPNFKEYQMKDLSEGTWVKCDSVVTLPLEKDRVEVAFHAVNAANVAGTDYKVLLTSND